MVKYLALALLVSCGNFKQRDQERTIQSEMLRALNSRTSEFARCAKEHKLFEKFGKKRIRVEMKLNIDYKGQVDRFQIDDKPYPSRFVDCMFAVAEKANYPRLEKSEEVELIQPFIFTK